MAGEASSSLIVLGIDPDSSGAIAALQWHMPSSRPAGEAGQPDPPGSASALPGQSTAQVPDLASVGSNAAIAVPKGLDQSESSGSSGPVQSAERSTQLSLQGATAEVMDIPCQLHKVGTRSRRQAQHVRVSNASPCALSTLTEPVCFSGGRQAQHGSVHCQSHVRRGCCARLSVSEQQQKASQLGAPPEDGCSLVLSMGCNTTRSHPAARGSRCPPHTGNSAVPGSAFRVPRQNHAARQQRLRAALCVQPASPAWHVCWSRVSADGMQTDPQSIRQWHQILVLAPVCGRTDLQQVGAPMLPDKPWHRPLSTPACRQTDPRQVAMLVQGLLQRFPGTQIRAVLEEPLPGSMNGKFSWYRSVSLQQHCMHRICTVTPSGLMNGSVYRKVACHAASQCYPALLAWGTSRSALGSRCCRGGRCDHGCCRTVHGCAR